MRKIVALTAGLLIATANAQTPSVDPDQAANRTTLQWPPGYIEPNTPGMKYVSPETPQGTGPYKAIMATDSGANEFVLYYPGNLNELGAKKMPIILWGNGSCTYMGNKFRNFLTEIASHGYLAISGGRWGRRRRRRSRWRLTTGRPRQSDPNPHPGLPIQTKCA